MWSKTKTAINTGYGIKNPYSVNSLDYRLQNRPIKRIPSFLDNPFEAGWKNNPIINRKLNRTLSMGLEGAGKALMKTSRKVKKLYGCGVEDIISSMSSELGSTAIQTLQTVAKQIGSSLKNLIGDPEKLMMIVKAHVPKLFTKVKNFFVKLFKRRKAEKEDLLNKQQAKEKLQQLLDFYKATDPEKYKQLYKQIRDQQIAKLQQEALAGLNTPLTETKNPDDMIKILLNKI